MMTIPKLVGSYGVTVLTLLAIAIPAQAITITPGATHVDANANNFQFQYGVWGTIRCTTSDFSGITTVRDNRLSGKLILGVSTSPTGCTAFGVEAFIRCTNGGITIQADTTDARGGGTGRWNFDRDFMCSVTVPAFGNCSITFRGTQGPYDRISYVAATRVLTLSVRTISATQDATNRTGLCGPATGSSTLMGDYRVTSPASLTITP